MLCRNLVAVSSGIMDEDNIELLTCQHWNVAELDFATDEDVRGAVRRLAAIFAVSPDEYQLRSQAIGFRHEPHSLLNDPALDGLVKPCTQFCHDWMHAICVQGSFNTCVWKLFEDLRARGVSEIWETMATYVQGWEWPMAVLSSNQHLVDCFVGKRKKSSRKAQTFKATASDCLSLYAVLAMFVSAVLLRNGARSVCHQGCMAFLALADLLDMLHAVPLGLVSPARLADAVNEFLKRCVAAGWSKWMHSKFHWLIHLPRHLERFGGLLTCFVHERKHRMVKRYADNIRNTRAYEKSIMGEVACHHLAQLRAGQCLQFGIALVGPKPVRPGLFELLQSTFAPHRLDKDLCSYSQQARLDPAGICCRKDVVLVRGAQGGNALIAGQVWLHASVDGIVVTLVNLFKPLAGDGEQRWDASQQRPEFVDTKDVLAVTIHTPVEDRIVRVIVPWRFRGWAAAER